MFFGTFRKILYYNFIFLSLLQKKSPQNSSLLHFEVIEVF